MNKQLKILWGKFAGMLNRKEAIPASPDKHKALPEWDLMMQHRPISECIRLFILPEIEKRKSSGSLNPSVLPLDVSQFLAYQIVEGGKVTAVVVKLNDECDVVFRVKLKEPKKYEKGQFVQLNDIELSECYILPPKHNGKPCGYFYFKRVFLTPFMVFDLSPNVPSVNSGDEYKIKYPVGEMYKHKWLIDKIKPYEMMEALIKKHWPPNPAYYPNILSKVQADPSILDSSSFLTSLNQIYTEKYWHERIGFWRDVNLFPKRIKYVEGAIQEHLQKKYDRAIFVLCPQFEGIIRDYLGSDAVRHYQSNLERLQRLILSRGILLYPKRFIEVIFAYLRTGTFWENTARIRDPLTMINRHGILHGEFSQFESEELSLRFLILLDTLAFMLVSDRMSAGTL